MKAPRFLREFAAFKAKQINNGYFYTDDEKAVKTGEIHLVVMDYEHGMITIDEAMKVLSKY